MNLFISLLGITAATTFVGVDISNDYINSVGTTISYDKVDTLKQIGFSEDEIDTLTEEKYNKFKSIDIIETYVKNYYIDETNIVTHIGENNVTPSDGISLTTDATYFDSDGSKQLTTYVSKYKEDGLDKVFVKQNVIWDKTPDKRLSDILTITYSNNVMLKAVDGYADVEMSLNYTETKYSKVGYKHKTPKYKEKTKVNEVKNVYSGKDKTMYNHDLGRYFAFKFDLPSNSYINNSTKGYYAISRTTYSNFKVTLESTFISMSSSNIGCAFQAHYVHQTGKGSFDWGKITFTNTAPYIIYNTSFWKNDPSYEEALFNDINVYF